MIFYKPYLDRQDIYTMFPHADLTGEKTVCAYVALEDDAILGKCLVEVTGYTCTITELVQTGADKLVTEGLVRAALNFAANRGAYLASCSIAQIADVLKILGFSEENGVFRGEIPELLKGSCCKHSETSGS